MLLKRRKLFEFKFDFFVWLNLNIFTCIELTVRKALRGVRSQKISTKIIGEKTQRNIISYRLLVEWAQIIWNKVVVSFYVYKWLFVTYFKIPKKEAGKKCNQTVLLGCERQFSVQNVSLFLIKFALEKLLEEFILASKLFCSKLFSLSLHIPKFRDFFERNFFEIMKWVTGFF